MKNALIQTAQTIGGENSFLHEEWFAQARTTRSNKGVIHRRSGSKKWSAADVLAEAQRMKNHCSHVINPQVPILHFGVPLSEVLSIAIEWAQTTTRQQPRAYRKNQPILMSGVISFPESRKHDDWAAYRDKSIAYLKRRFGNRLRCVIEHIDERHPHIHYYAVPLYENTDGSNISAELFGTVHAGYAATRKTKAEFKALYGTPKPDENGKWSEGAKTRRAFNTAMSSVQDIFFDEVGQHFGLKRVGPLRERMEYKEVISLRNIQDLEVSAAAISVENARVKGQLEGQALDLQRRESALLDAEAQMQEEIRIHNEKICEEVASNADLCLSLRKAVEEELRDAEAFTSKAVADAEAARKLAEEYTILVEEAKTSSKEMLSLKLDYEDGLVKNQDLNDRLQSDKIQAAEIRATAEAVSKASALAFLEQVSGRNDGSLDALITVLETPAKLEAATIRIEELRIELTNETMQRSMSQNEAGLLEHMLRDLHNEREDFRRAYPHLFKDENKKVLLQVRAEGHPISVKNETEKSTTDRRPSPHPRPKLI